MLAVGAVLGAIAVAAYLIATRLPIEADVVDARAWDPDAARAGVRSFLDTRVLQ